MKKILRILFLSIFILFGFFNSNAQWQQTKGPGRGDITCMASMGSDIFAATSQNGIYYSSDNGLNWSPKNNGLIRNNGYIVNFNSLVVSGNNIFAGAGYSGIFLSTNKGQSWSDVSDKNWAASYTALAVCGNNIFAGSSYGGILRSTDNGQSWEPASNGLAGNGGISCFAVNSTFRL